ncbi:hypothetical protein RW1_022_00280 [Rhodococcus wratislaviensis NBRC 100605]|uniref:Uncharacterized protein n=1 Tax=Rhodococcus wratislaviensis NBRC 100605 TaxID=1219028 RepID=X0Q352_RHOWR|nr:hypothetical protein RW1_022_00280 [Rhodococcus wratislaviensis NBRC 100605]
MACTTLRTCGGWAAWRRTSPRWRGCIIPSRSFPSRREAAAWILDDHDAIDRFDTTPAEIVTLLGYDLQARSRGEAEHYLNTAKTAFAAEHDPTTGPADVQNGP